MSSQIAPITLADLQQPVRDRLEQVPEELRRIVEADFGLIAAGQLAPVPDAGQDVPAHPAAAGRRGHRVARSAHHHPRRGGRADPPRHAGPRRLGGPLGPPARHADDQLAVQPPGVGHHGRLPVLARGDRAGPAGRPGAAPGAEPGHQRDDRGRDAPAPGARAARVLRGVLRSPDSGQDRLAALGRLRGRRALRAPAAERAALRRFGEALGMAFQIVDDLLDYVGDPRGHRQADRLGPAGAQGDAAADRRAAADGRGRNGAGWRRSWIRPSPTTPRSAR